VENKSQEEQRDIRFVREVQLTTKVTYVSAEVPTKSRVSFNPKPLELQPRSPRFFTINPHEKKDNTNFHDSITILWELPGNA
jgi:hypothetical protein